MTVIASEQARNKPRKLNGQNQSGPSHFLAPFRVIHDGLCVWFIMQMLVAQHSNNALPHAGQKPNWQQIKDELSSNLSPQSIESNRKHNVN